MDLVSIILPYYKKKIYIKDTINSILDQTYQNFEIIIIDDELSDESIKVLNEIYFSSRGNPCFSEFL